MLLTLIQYKKILFFLVNNLKLGDFDGNIIIWDIKEGLLLNIFKELAMPI